MMNKKGNESKRGQDKKTVRRMGEENKGRAGAYLTDNVVIVRQVVSVSLGCRRRGVAQFPYVWLGTVGRGGNREAIRLRLVALRTVLTAGGKRRDRCEGYGAFSHVVLQSVTLCGDFHKTEYITQHLTPTLLIPAKPLNPI